MINRLLGFALALLLIPTPSAALVAPQEAFPRATPESQGLSAEAMVELAREVSGYVERGLIVGGELLVVKNRRTVLHKTFGLADREESIPWTVGTVANIRSMTKPITGAARIRHRRITWDHGPSDADASGRASSTHHQER